MLFLDACQKKDFSISSSRNVKPRAQPPLQRQWKFFLCVLQLDQLQMGVLPSGGSLTTESFNLLNIGTKTNWSGDDSASAFRGTDIGNFGGANVTGADPFDEAAINGNTFEGSAGQALYWSRNSMIIPEPSGLAFAALGLLLVFGRRRR